MLSCPSPLPGDVPGAFTRCLVLYPGVLEVRLKPASKSWVQSLHLGILFAGIRVGSRCATQVGKSGKCIFRLYSGSSILVPWAFHFLLADLQHHTKPATKAYTSLQIFQTFKETRVELSFQVVQYHCIARQVSKWIWCATPSPRPHFAEPPSQYNISDLMTACGKLP